jgi:nucleoside-diphosphate kinase
MAEEATLVIIKPDAIQRGLVGTVLSRLETLRLELVGAKVTRVSEQAAETHYAHIRDKPFFRETVEYLQGKRHGTSAVLALVYWGAGAVARVRALTGATHPERAHPDTIRGSLGRMATNGLMENVLHASASPEEAAREIPLWFASRELTRPV